MTYVILTNYCDGPSDVLYNGPDLLAGVRKLTEHHCTSWRIQIWDNGLMLEEMKK